MNPVIDYFESLVSDKYHTPAGFRIENHYPHPIQTSYSEGEAPISDPNSSIWQYFKISDNKTGVDIAIVSIGNINRQINFRDTAEKIPPYSCTYPNDVEAIEWAKKIIEDHY